MNLNVSVTNDEKVNLVYLKKEVAGVKRNKFRARLIIIALIFLMTLLGVSYASWNDNLYLDATAKTGNIQLIVESVKSERIDNFSITENTGEQICFEGTMDQGEEGKLELGVRNTGLLPVKYNDILIYPGSFAVIDVQIPADFEDTHLHYTTTNGTWEKSLYLAGTITVDDSLLDSETNEQENELNADNSSQDIPVVNNGTDNNMTSFNNLPEIAPSSNKGNSLDEGQVIKSNESQAYITSDSGDSTDNQKSNESNNFMESGIVPYTDISGTGDITDAGSGTLKINNLGDSADSPEESGEGN